MALSIPSAVPAWFEYKNVVVVEAAMEFDAFIKQAERDAKVVDALYLARHMLASYHGLIVHSEREQLKTDFSPQLEQIDTALGLLGIDIADPMNADPINAPTPRARRASKSSRSTGLFACMASIVTMLAILRNATLSHPQ
jgi:hypothetical protein